MERCGEGSSLKDRQFRTSGGYQFANRRALEDPDKSDLEGYSEEDASAIQHFLPGREGEREFSSESLIYLVLHYPTK